MLEIDTMVLTKILITVMVIMRLTRTLMMVILRRAKDITQDNEEEMMRGAK